jgi:hypothetical protein
VRVAVFCDSTQPHGQIGEQPTLLFALRFKRLICPSHTTVLSFPLCAKRSLF